MKPHVKSIYHNLVLGIIISLFLICSPAWAILWDGGTDANDFTSTGANWDPDAVPGAGDAVTLIFGNTTGDNLVDVDIAFTALTGLDFTGADAIYTIGESGAGDLGFGTDKIITNPVALTHVISSSMTSAGLTFNLDNALTVSGAISGTTITKTGAGTLTLSGTNTYTGLTTISGGTLTLSGGVAIADTGAVSLADVASAILELSTSETIGSLAGGGTTGGNVTLNANTLTVGDATSTTYSGAISGAGALTKQGAGTLTLDGTNAYLGTTTISAGTLKVSGGAAIADAGAVTLANDATAVFELSSSETIGSLAGGGGVGGNVTLNANTLTVGDAANTTYSGAISGAGGLTKLGTGTLTLDGTNAYLGTTTISAGTLKVDNSAAIADTGAVSLADVATAIFELAADETIGSLAGGGATGGNVNLGGFGLTVGDATSTTYAGVISGGAGTLTKQGAGTLTLSGINTYTGLTDITAGTLTGAFTVGGNLTVRTGATFAPGSSIGITTVAGNYVQAAGSTLEVEVEKTSSGTLRSDLVDVGGTAAIGGTINVLDISPAGRLIGTGDTFNIIQAGGAITDNGPTITDNSAVLSFAGLVSGNFYQLVATRAAFATVITGGNRGAVLGAIDSDLGSATGDYVTLINALTALNSTQLNDAAEQLNPLPHASATIVSRGTTQRMAGNLANYLSARRSGIGRLMTRNTQSRQSQLLIADASSDPRMLAYVINEDRRIAKMQQDEMDSQVKGFFRPFGVLYDHDSTSKMTGFRAKAVGAQFGFDKSFGQNLLMGIGGGYSRSFIKFKDGRGEGDVDSFRIGPYASYFKDDFFIDTSVSLGYHKNENERNIKFGTINRTADSDYHAYDLSAYIGGGYDFHVNKLTVTPTTSFQYIRYRSESFKETGAGAAGMDVDAATSQSLRSKLGVTLSTVTELYGAKIVPELFAGWAHEFMDDEDIKARFVQGTAKFTTDVDSDWDDSVYFGAGISALLKKNISAFVRYEGEYSSGNGINALNVGITLLF